jgi:hypothetical protein
LDNGGKFESRALGTFLASKGIKTKQSLPYHHYQNGAIERYNRSVADMGRSVLTDSNLPQGFWGFAFLWANYTLNRLLKKVSGHKTPFEAFFGYKPSVDHLRVFGSKAFILIPPKKRKKLDDRAVESHVIGYIDGSKGWMFWVPSDNRVECSAWVQFADNPLKLTTGKLANNPKVDPNLSHSDTQDIDPALLAPNAQALRFVMAMDLGDFMDEVTVQQQELVQDRIANATKSPAPVPKKYKDILNHLEKEGWLKAIQEEL